MLISTEEIAKFWYEKLETCPEIADMGIYLKTEGEDTVEIDGVWQAVCPERGTWWTRDDLRLGRDQPWPGGEPWPLPPAGMTSKMTTILDMERSDTVERAAARLAEEPYVRLDLLQKPTRALATLSTILVVSEARATLKLAVLPGRTHVDDLPITRRLPPPTSALRPAPPPLSSSFPSPPSPPSSIGDDLPDPYDYASAPNSDFLDTDFY